MAKATPLSRTRAGAWAVFERRYAPIPLDPIHKDMLRQFDELPKGIDYKYVWTVIEGDTGRSMYLAPGFHLVNRMGYVLCANPFPVEEESQPGYVY